MSELEQVPLDREELRERLIWIMVREDALAYDDEPPITWEDFQAKRALPPGGIGNVRWYWDLEEVADEMLKFAARTIFIGGI